MRTHIFCPGSVYLLTCVGLTLHIAAKRLPVHALKLLTATPLESRLGLVLLWLEDGLGRQLHVKLRLTADLTAHKNLKRGLSLQLL